MMSNTRRRHRVTLGLTGPGLPARHGYTAEVRANQSRAQTGKPHPQYRQQCSCGLVTTPGPMRMHTKATEHYLVKLWLPRA
jgi:hypothetical protein